MVIFVLFCTFPHNVPKLLKMNLPYLKLNIKKKPEEAHRSVSRAVTLKHAN